MEVIRKNSKVKKKSNSGISLISLAVTIIVIIILSTIVIISSHRTVGSANYAKFAHELSEIQDKVTAKRRENRLLGVDKKYANTGFIKVEIENVPSEFESFDENKITGYWVKFDTINEKDIRTGREELSTDVVTFGKTDVYVYDAAGKVFYAKGWYDEDEKIHYRVDTEETDGPEITSVSYVLNSGKTKAIVTVGAMPINGGALTVTIGKNIGTQVGENTYEVEVTKNGTATVSVTEEGSGTSTRNITIAGIIELEDKTPPKIMSLIGTDGKLLVKIIGAARDDESKIVGYAYTENGAQPSNWESVESNSINQTYTVTKDGVFTFWVKNEAGLINSENISVTIKREKYTITYDANGGSLGNVPSIQEKLEGINTNLSNETPKRVDFEFLGWSTDSSDTTPLYGAGATYVGNGNVTLYAIWKQIIVSVSRLTIESVNDQAYTGGEIKPEPIVKDGDEILTNGVHYMLTYSNNTNVGTANIILTGKGKYNGTLTASFKITSGSMKGVSAIGYTGTYDKLAHGISVSLAETSTGGTIKYGTTEGSYTLTSSPTFSDVGDHIVYYQVTKANYTPVTGSAVVKITSKIASALTASLETTSYVYDGTVKKPGVVVKDGETQLTSGTDYMVTYDSTADVGTKKIIITCQGNYSGTIKTSFEITNATMKGISATGFTGTYDRVAHGISVNLSDTSSGATVRYGTEAGTYSLASSPTYTDAGTYTVFNQVTKANYNPTTGSAVINISAKSASSFTINLSSTSYSYDGNAKTPTITVKDGSTTLAKDKDYTIGGTTSGTNAATYTITISGKGNYNGTNNATFTINKVTNTLAVTGSAGLLYTGSPQTLAVATKAQGAVYYKVGTELTSGNYTSGNTAIPTETNAGTYVVYYYTPGNTNYNASSGSVKVTIAKKNVTKPTVSTTEYTYTGSSITLGVSSFDSTTMKIVGNVQTASGSYTATISLKNANNYQWADGTTSDININWKIKQSVVTLTNTLSTGRIHAFGDDPADEKTVSLDIDLTGVKTLSFDISSWCDYANIVDSSVYLVANGTTYHSKSNPAFRNTSETITWDVSSISGAASLCIYGYACGEPAGSWGGQAYDAYGSDITLTITNITLKY